MGVRGLESSEPLLWYPPPFPSSSPLRWLCLWLLRDITWRPGVFILFVAAALGAVVVATRRDDDDVDVENGARGAVSPPGGEDSTTSAAASAALAYAAPGEVLVLRPPRLLDEEEAPVPPVVEAAVRLCWCLEDAWDPSIGVRGFVGVGTTFRVVEGGSGLASKFMKSFSPRPGVSL